MLILKDLSLSHDVFLWRKCVRGTGIKGDDRVEQRHILTVLGSAKHLILMSPSHSHTSTWQVQVQQFVWILSAPACPHTPTPVGVGHALTNKKFYCRLTLVFNHHISQTLLAHLSLSYTPKEREFESSFEQGGLHLSRSTYP